MPLNPQTSIVDLLRSRNLPTDLGFRSQLYESFGLGTRDQFLSGARTTGSTNVQLLQRLGQNPSLLDQISAAVRSRGSLQGLNLNSGASGTQPGGNVQPTGVQSPTQPPSGSQSLPNTVEDINSWQMAPSAGTQDFSAFSDGILSRYAQSQSTIDELLRKYIDAPTKTVGDFVNQENQIRQSLGLDALDKQYTDLLTQVNNVEQDIRSEAAATGGVVSDSQVKSLAAERVKNLTPQLNTLQTQLQLKNDLASRISSEYNVSEREAQSRADSMLSNYLSVQKAQQEQTTTVANQVAPAIYQQAGGDPNKMQQLVSQAASKYGIDPSVLYSSALSYKTDYEKQQTLNAAQTADLLAKTAEGGTVNVPGVGDVKVLGTLAQKPDTLSAGGKVYQWVNGKFVDTGIPDNAFTPANIVSALSAMGNSTDPSISSMIGSVLRQYGVNVPITGDVSISIPENTIAAVNNNPGNLRYVGQDGATLGQGGFARFNSPEEGYQALRQQIELDKTRDFTVSAFINKYAPPAENDTGLYVRQLTAALGVAPNSRIKNIDTDQLAQFIAQKESGASVTPIQGDVQTNARALLDGSLVPSMLPGLGQGKAKVLAEANRLSMAETGKPYNAAQEQIKFEAAKRFAGNMNSSQMIRFKGLAGSVVNTIDEVKTLASQLKQSGIAPLNKVKLEAARNLYGNTQKGQLVSQYLAAVNTLKEEFANLANGGYAPTEAAWGLANSQINANYGVDQLNASLVEVQKLINYRVNAFNDVQPYGGFGSSAQTRTVGGRTYYLRSDGKYYTSP